MKKLNLTVRNLIKSVFWGIEEEGYTYHIFEGKTLIVTSLDTKPQKRRLGVGIGIDDKLYNTLSWRN